MGMAELNNIYKMSKDQETLLPDFNQYR